METSIAQALSNVQSVTQRMGAIAASRYTPYVWQDEFHEAGVEFPERMLMAANRVGKTKSAAAEVAFHLTGKYPEWWKGKRFDHPVLVWTGSPTNETSKDIVQKELLGGIGEDVGTGSVPKKLIVGKPSTRQAGVRGVVDSFQVRHSSGGLSTCILKTYEQGWVKWQGTAPHVVWLDEEPDDYMIYSEAQTRTLTSNGIVLVTFTPLHGVTELVQHFQQGGPGIFIKGATWDDAPHLSKEDKERLAGSYRAHERDARTKGTPMLGEGSVFPVPEESLLCDPFQVPDHYARIKGCDFGMDHPAAGVEIAWDRDFDVMYVVDCYKRAGETSAYHATWFNKNRDHNRHLIPVAWPHDGINTEKSGGSKVMQAYKNNGVRMLSKSACYPKDPGGKEKYGPQPVEPIVEEVLSRMLEGRFKVFSNQRLWLEDFRSYHRKDGKIVARNDDILKATFYAVMMKRYAVPMTSLTVKRRIDTGGPVAHL